jgi:GTPase SAR1 family protein
VYDLTNMESFRRAKMWVRELHQVNGNDMVIGLAGNKLDLAIDNQRQIDTRTTIEYAEDNGLIFLETSAKRGDNVIEMFMSIAKAVIAKQPVKKQIDSNEEFQPKPNSQTSVGISCCCGVGGKDESKS